MTTHGRITLPIQEGLDDVIPGVLERLGADAVRNSDGTWLPESVSDLAAKVYETYFVARGDQAWALAHRDERTSVYLQSNRTSALSADALDLRVMDGYFSDQVEPDIACDTARWWQVIDRTTGDVLSSDQWEVSGEGADVTVTIARPTAHHVYTVNFLARQTWDSTQMYNYLTNGWQDDPTRVKEQPYDARYPATWEHMREGLQEWLDVHPQVDVVRFTTFFYHFTLVFDDQARERFVDWFGYSASVSVPAMEEFERETGIALTAEDFVDEGYYNSPFRVPSTTFKEWIAFQHRFVTARVKDLVDLTHADGKEAMMFLGDNWIGTEPYGPHFAATGIDAVVGSVGSAATCRMISDIPGVRYTEGRLLPYFFPDVFHEGGAPAVEARESWAAARRAIVRSPLDRIGFGGYLSLALEHPDFMDVIEGICQEFRDIHKASNGSRPAVADFSVGIVNAWGQLRSWQTHMVAHALWYQHTYSYVGLLEALAGLPFTVKFLSFDDIREGVPEDVGVLINAGGAGTAFSGGPEWLDVDVQAAVRRFVATGGGLIGVGEPTAATWGGATLQLSDVFGVDREVGWSLSTTRYTVEDRDHWILAGTGGTFDRGQGVGAVSAPADGATVLQFRDSSVDLAVNFYGQGRAVYAAGLPYSADNARVLHRAIYWAAGRETQADHLGWSSDPRVECAWYPNTRQVFAYNSTADAVRTVLSGPFPEREIEVPGYQSVWIDAQ
ncbi:1,3-beta-galactosyl-N-acetylhexosamine phosphorylase [Demequina sp.]|uniref:1,3-beta-galactosyl-N-acetylhexosamine phosphorylase n=1 Tax=Demequina sp. TaxID=2050685 RepID=UPI003A876255